MKSSAVQVANTGITSEMILKLHLFMILKVTQNMRFDLKFKIKFHNFWNLLIYVKNLSQFTKELSLCHKLWFSNPYIFATQCRKYFCWENNLSLKYLRFTQSRCKDLGIRQFEIAATTQFHCTTKRHVQNCTVTVHSVNFN